MSVKHQNSTVARDNPDELSYICERIAARDVLEYACGVSKYKTLICKDGEVSPLVQSKRQTIGARIEASCQLQHPWRDIHPRTVCKHFCKGLTDTTESAPKVESLAVAVDPETACLDVADGRFDVPFARLPEASKLIV
jgi:hypothetical protein